MSASVVALIIGVVGVIGTLASGLLAHRSALRTKRIELDHAERQVREERRESDRQTYLAARRAMYVTLNQNLRNYHGALWRLALALRAPDGPGEERRDRAGQADGTRQALSDSYAEAQMLVADDVLVVVGTLTHQLHLIYTILVQHHEGEPADEDLDAVQVRLVRGSEGLYEARQTMRKDLGITSLPISRPPDQGAH
jgi:hypothetical protein